MQQIRITLKSFDHECLFNALKHIITIAHVLEIKTTKRIDLPKKIKKITVTRSPHIDKKSREQFEIRQHKSVCIFNLEKKHSVFLLIECLKNSKLTGVELAVDICSRSYYSL